MKKEIYSCDKCKKEFAHKDLTKLKLEFNRKYDSEHGVSWSEVERCFDLCEPCTLSLGLKIRINNEVKTNKELSSSEKLLEVLQQIIKDQIQ